VGGARNAIYSWRVESFLLLFRKKKLESIKDFKRQKGQARK
jgi:hypothetical protein